MCLGKGNGLTTEKVYILLKGTTRQMTHATEFMAERVGMQHGQNVVDKKVMGSCSPQVL